MLGGELLADLAQLKLGDTRLLIAERAQRLQLDRQAVGIVAGHIGCLKAGHILIADDDVLDDLVERGAHVDVAVGIRRAVVQDVLRLALVVLDHLLIDMVVLPVLEHLGLFFRQAGPHFKRGLHLMDGVVVVLRQGFLLSSIFWIDGNPACCQALPKRCLTPAGPTLRGAAPYGFFQRQLSKSTPSKLSNAGEFNSSCGSALTFLRVVRLAAVPVLRVRRTGLVSGSSYRPETS